MRTGLTIAGLERASHGQEHGLGYMDQTIGLQERVITRQRRVVEAATAGKLNAGPARELLRVMEVNLAKLHAWRLRLLSLHLPRGDAWRGDGWRGDNRRATVPHEQRARPRAGAARAAAADR